MGSAREVILAWVDAFNRRDAEAAAALYHDDATNLQVAIGQPLVGRPAILEDLRGFFRAFPVEIAAPGDILIFDGIFLHRPELRAHWDYSVFLEVRFAVSVARMAERDASSPDPGAASNRRYVGGQEIYLARCHPRRWASVVINNDDLDSPYIVEPAREVTP